MLLLADRYFLGYKARVKARHTRAQLLWRTKKNAVLPVDQTLPDGLYLSHLNPPMGDKDMSLQRLPVSVRPSHLERGRQLADDGVHQSNRWTPCN